MVPSFVAFRRRAASSGSRYNDGGPGPALRGNTLRDDGKWAQHAIVAFAHRTIGSDLEDMSITDDHLAVEVLEGAEPEIAVLSQRADPDRTLVDSLDERDGR